jgi:hypothetical protein
MNGINIAAGAGPKPEALAATLTQPITLFPAETHAKENILHAKL